jgi:fibronectin type 3 domain-containing protein
MKTPVRLLLTAMAGLLIGPAAHALPIITQVVETGGDGAPTAKFTGETFTGATIGTYTVPLFGEDVKSFADRLHEWNGATPSLPIPDYLLGGEYIMIRNDNRDNTSLRLDITLSSAAHVYVLVDNRLPDGVNTTPPNLSSQMTWLLANGWEPVRTGHNRTGNAEWPDEIGVDESSSGPGVGPGVSIDQYASIYGKTVPAGTFSAFQADNAGRNMYGIVVKSAEPPPVPENVAAISGNGRVSLSWSASLGATGYAVKRSVTSGGPYVVIATPSSTSHIDTDVVNGSTYYYVVASVNAVGESPLSPEVIGQPQSAPSNLIATGGAGEVQLTWSSFEGAASYIVKRADSSGGPYSMIATDLPGLSYVDAGVEGGRTYFYAVAAQLAGGGESGQSIEAPATTVPNAPANLAVAIHAASVIGLSWATQDAVVTEFVIERSMDGSTFVPIATVPGSQRNYQDEGASLGTTYFYRAQAINTSGASPYSLVASTTTPEAGWNVNFANGAAPTPLGYLQDVGLPYGDRGNGFSYGWDRNITEDARYRQNQLSPDLRHDTFNHLQKAVPSAIWEIQVPNGFYWVYLAAGDATATDSVFQFDVEGVVTPAKTPTTSARWQTFTTTAMVEDGLLTITSGPLAQNNKLAFVDIYSAVSLGIGIDRQPQPVTVEENKAFTLAVTVTNALAPNNPFYGVEPITYQWYLDGGVIPGATASTLSVSRAQLAQSGAYHVVVENPEGIHTSDTVQVTVIPDVQPPQVTGVASLDGMTISICFDELLDQKLELNTATDPFNYFVNFGSVPISSVTMWHDGQSVLLHLGAPVSGNFVVEIHGVEDAAGNKPTAAVEVEASVLGWSSLDIGNLPADPLEPGLVLACGLGRVEIIAGGTDIWNMADGFHYASRPQTGDFDLKVRVESLLQRDPWTKAGLMARVDLDADSRHIAVVTTPAGGQNVFQTVTRAVKGGSSTEPVANLRPSPVPYPEAWVRLKREGDTFTTYHSDNGADWNLFVTHTPSPAYPETIHVGLAVTSHNNQPEQTTIAVFRDFGAIGVEPPVLTALDYTGASFSLSFTAEAGVNYVVEYSNALSDPLWTALESVAGDGSVKVITDPGAAGAMRFYRVRVE